MCVWCVGYFTEADSFLDRRSRYSEVGICSHFAVKQSNTLGLSQISFGIFEGAKGKGKQGHSKKCQQTDREGHRKKASDRQDRQLAHKHREADIHQNTSLARNF